MTEAQEIVFYQWECSYCENLNACDEQEFESSFRRGRYIAFNQACKSCLKTSDIFFIDKDELKTSDTKKVKDISELANTIVKDGISEVVQHYEKIDTKVSEQSALCFISNAAKSMLEEQTKNIIEEIEKYSLEASLEISSGDDSGLIGSIEAIKCCSSFLKDTIL